MTIETKNPAVVSPNGGELREGATVSHSNHTKPRPLLQAAVDLAARGWYVFPCKGKRPLVKWRDRSANAPGLVQAHWKRWRHANIGLDCGKSKLVVIDLDIHADLNGVDVFRALCDTHAIDTRGALISRTGSGGLHLIFSDPTGGLIGNSAGKLGPGIDVRGNGGYIIAPPSIHPQTKQPYRWERDGTPAPLPPALVRLLLKVPEPEPEPVPVIDLDKGNGHYAHYVQAALDHEIQALANTLTGSRNDTLNNAAIALGELVAASWANLDQQTVESELYNACINNGLVQDDGERSVRKTIASGLKKGLAQPRPKPQPQQQEPVTPVSPSLAEEPPTGETVSHIKKVHPEQLPTEFMARALKRNEMGDAEILARLYPQHLRYDHSTGTWYFWNGNYWEEDRMNRIRNLVNRQVGGQYLQAAASARQADNTDLSSSLAKRASALGTKARLANILDLASSLPALALSGDEWDANPMLLGVANGVLDLKTGEHRPGMPDDYIQKTSPTTWLGLDHPAPRWEQFLREIFNEDQTLIDFMQRLFGYGMTGLHVEHIFCILWGDGRNGKDTLLEALSNTLGTDLADRVPQDVLMSNDSRRGNASPELMELRGQRLAWVSETKQHARLNANQVKDITGRSTLKARPLYGDFVTFKVQYLLFLLTNNKPVIPADDFAIWKRVLLIPFELAFVDHPQAPNERPRDPNLGEKLKAEASGILAWLVRGCLTWQREGLNPPESVINATKAYREEENTLVHFIEECCYVEDAPEVFTEAVALRNAYNEWAKLNGEQTLNHRVFGQRITKLFERDKHPNNQNRRTIYRGVGLLQD